MRRIATRMAFFIANAATAGIVGSAAGAMWVGFGPGGVLMFLGVTAFYTYGGAHGWFGS